MSYWKRYAVVSTENVSVFIPLILRGKVSGSGALSSAQLSMRAQLKNHSNDEFANNLCVQIGCTRIIFTIIIFLFFDTVNTP